MLPTSLTNLIFPLLNLFYEPAQRPLSPPRNALQFELRHSHAVTPSAHVFLSDAPARSSFNGIRQPSLSLHSTPVKTFKPSSPAAFSRARARSMERGESEALRWDEELVPGPDVESRETLLLLAKMTSNAYIEPGSDGWYDLDGNWTLNDPVGWEPDADGIRGYVFATSDNSTIILSIKGTSASVGGGGPTQKKDKINDNLLFSCCCAHVDWTWTTVCDCFRGGWKCNQDCVEQALIDDSLFYPIGTNLYNNITYLYPNSNIWIVGHSLGGALSSLLGVTFGVPVVAFEAPGEKMAAQRLHLPSPPSVQHITHVYHTADPISMGTCNGVFSSCAIGGYAMESRCHLGRVIEYDTVSNLSWAVDIRTHPILRVIEGVLNQSWAHAVAQGREVPESHPQEDCVECYSWDFGNYTNGTK
ncbi:alpha/beta-hydrolase [Artomyces pyxidatus]|uniref:Alpha/beta-hydrolase n=1 Tax=Artomyces pyxidatus TaxID=48021 RepID=A0ACB8TFY0_9AGAM|nr:alpha/beta-hydrolase [Artomyces pyxidatus]